MNLPSAMCENLIETSYLWCMSWNGRTCNYGWNLKTIPHRIASAKKPDICRDSTVTIVCMSMYSEKSRKIRLVCMISSVATVYLTVPTEKFDLIHSLHHAHTQN